MDERNWRQTLKSFQTTLATCDHKNKAQLIQLMHPTLMAFLHKDENLQSDKIDYVFRIYHTVYSESTNGDDLVGCSSILDELSAILFRISTKASTPDLPWSCLSEECCLTLARVIRTVAATSAQKQTSLSLYAAKSLPMLSHLCSTLLEMSEFASYRAVRKEALQTLKVMFRPMDTHSKKSYVKIRKSVVHFLPGVCQTLCRIVTGDQKIGTVVKEAALDAWAAYLAVIFSPSEDNRSQNTASSTSGTQTNSAEQPPVFSPDWYVGTVPKIQILVQKTVDNFLNVQLHFDVVDGDRLSIAFTHWLSTLLFDCVPSIDSKLSEPLRNTVVSGLVTLAARTVQLHCLTSLLEMDNIMKSSNLARDALLEFVKKEDQKFDSVSLPETLSGSRLLRKITIEAVSGQIAMLTTHLPISIDENLIQNRLRSIHGCLSLMDSNSLSVLASSRDLLHRLCAGLAEFLAFNTSCIEVFDESLSTGNPISASPSITIGRISFPNLFIKSFQQFRDPKTLYLVQSAVAQIASQDDTIDLFIDTCQDLMLLSGGLHRNPCLLLMSSGLAGFLSNDSIPWTQRQMESLRILKEYFETEMVQALAELNKRTQSFSENTSDKEVSLLQSFANVTILKTTHDCPGKESERDSSTTVKELKQNTITVCLLLELVCVVSAFIGTKANQSSSKHDVPYASDLTEDLLRFCLSPCFALASWSGLIGQTASQCLRKLATDCANSSVAELITRNADYLISSITLELHRVILRNPATGPISPELLNNLRSTCQTMLTLFEHASFEILPLLRPMVRQVLSCLDLTYEHHVNLFLPALKRLVLTCRQWHAVSQGHPVPSTFCNPPEALEAKPVSKLDDPFSAIAKRTLENLDKLLVDTRRMHHISSASTTSEDVNMDYASATDNSTEQPTAADELEPHSRIYPDQLHIVEEVMLRCIHLLATNDPKLRILSMEVLIEGCLTLIDENDLLLPLVHKIWPSLMARFRDRFAIVVEKAFQLLIVLSNVAGDFLRSRASSDVIPPLVTFLNRGVSVSANATESYRHLTSYRVQRELLTRIGLFCSDLGLGTDALRPVAQLCALYLAANQPPGLRLAALNSLKVLWSLDPGLVWFVLVSRVPPHRTANLFASIPDDGRFPRIELMTSSQADDSSGISPESLKELLSELASTV